MIEAAVSETGDLPTAFSVCPRVVSLKNPGKTARVPVRVCNLSAKTIRIESKSVLCNLEEVNVLRSVPLCEKSDAENEEVNVYNIQNDEPHRDFGVDIEDSELTEEQKSKVFNLFKKWETIFPKSKIDIGHTAEVKHKIELTDETPFKEPYRRVPPHLFNEVKEHLQEMIEIGAIKESKSPWSSNIVVVRKKDGSLRCCIDFRKLNSRTKKDAYAIPKVEDTLHMLAGSKYFSKIDLISGYWQIALEDDD